MNNISIRHLTAFVEIANCASFTRASRVLNVTQSTLTASIKQLELQAGLSLFDRTTRQVTLTKEGQRFYPVAKRLIIEFRLAMDDLTAGAEQQRGHITISTSPSGNSFLLPELVKNYHQNYPKIDITIFEAGATTIEEHILSKTADFGIGGNHSHHSELIYRPILEDRYGAVMPVDHPFSKQRQLSWSQLTTEKMLHLSPENSIRNELDNLQQQNIIQYPIKPPVIETSTPNGLAALVRNRVGITVLPSLAALAITATDLVFVPIVGPTRSRELCLVTRKDSALSPAALSMLDMLDTLIKTRAVMQQQYVKYLIKPTAF